MLGRASDFEAAAGREIPSDAARCWRALRAAAVPAAPHQGAGAPEDLPEKIEQTSCASSKAQRAFYDDAARPLPRGAARARRDQGLEPLEDPRARGAAAPAAGRLPSGL
jgi:hypothetical protein